MIKIDWNKIIHDTIVKIIVGVLFAVGLIIWGTIDFASLKGVVLAIWNSVIWFLTISIPIWFFLIISGLVILSIWIFGKWRSRKKPFLKYTEDVFNGVRCKWCYDKRGDIVDLKVFCPKCNTLTMWICAHYNVVPHMWKCCNCSEEHLMWKHELEILIKSNIENGTYHNNAK